MCLEVNDETIAENRAHLHIPSSTLFLQVGDGNFSSVIVKTFDQELMVAVKHLSFSSRDHRRLGLSSKLEVVVIFTCLKLLRK